MTLTTSIMMTTKNRVDDLKRTCQVLHKLNPTALELLITADGCSDRTIEFVKSDVPDARLFVNEQGKGSVYSRDNMMRAARGDLVFSVDDDSYPEQANCLALLVPLFEKHPQLAVLSFPKRTDEYPATLKQTDFGPARVTRSFANSGAVYRRSTYLKLAGFEPRFFHIYEEPDYALQCFAADYEIHYSPIVTIRHHYSWHGRSEMRNHHRQSRNELWSTLMRCPFPQLGTMIGYRAFSQFRFACKHGWSWALREPIWWWQALEGVPYCLKKRNAMRWSRYKAWLQLK
jgi:GT2 family glycosyltransferase